MYSASGSSALSYGLPEVATAAVYSSLGSGASLAVPWRRHFARWMRKPSAKRRHSTRRMAPAIEPIAIPAMDPVDSCVVADVEVCVELGGCVEAAVELAD